MGGREVRVSEYQLQAAIEHDNDRRLEKWLEEFEPTSGDYDNFDSLPEYWEWEERGR